MEALHDRHRDPVLAAAPLSPKSIFTSNCIAALPIEEGIVTLLNQTIKVTKNGITEEWSLEDEASYFAALQTYFGLTLNVPFSLIKKYF